MDPRKLLRYPKLPIEEGGMSFGEGVRERWTGDYPWWTKVVDPLGSLMRTMEQDDLREQAEQDRVPTVGPDIRQQQLYNESIIRQMLDDPSNPARNDPLRDSDPMRKPRQVPPTYKYEDWVEPGMKPDSPAAPF
jgi:hypothetical protein